jgi:hypothetical protein
MTWLGSSGPVSSPGAVVRPAMTVHVERVVVLAVRDHHELDPIAHRGLEVGALVAGLVVDRHVVEDDRVRLVGEDVSLAADDHRAVEALAEADRAVFGADDVVVVVPVARTARPPGAVLAAAGGVGAPGVRTGVARFDLGPAQFRAVAGDLVVHAVDVQTRRHVHGVLDLDVGGVALVELDQRAGYRGLALLEAVAHRSVGELLDVELEVLHLAARGRGPDGTVRGGGVLRRHERQRCRDRGHRGPAQHHPPAEAASVHVVRSAHAELLQLGAESTELTDLKDRVTETNPGDGSGIASVYPHSGQSSCDPGRTYWRVPRKGLASMALLL